MRVTLMGSGDAVGVPAPLCGCEYCVESERRRRPAVLVEVDDRTVVLDIGPDIARQLDEMDVYDVDGFFATHAHFDNYWGINELGQAAMKRAGHGREEFDSAASDPEFTVYGSRPVRTFTEDTFPYVLDYLDYEPVDPGEAVRADDVRIRAFAVDHGTTAFPTQGYAVSAGERTVVYAPDVDGPGEIPDYCVDADLLFFDGSVLDEERRGDRDATELREFARRFEADRIVATNVSEHGLGRHTDSIGEGTAFEIWSDFDSVSL
ncbi:MBL fold metallo-hydrolase [Halosimplex salinum]|uniref:MBL fold metallo-hydrolase n=1 Tax=Halosimplex salinum TaxID=1710538 RepID=UPI000F46FB0A|nr:MBL fold metallo-hydrolase [Halosimplex salinum]